MKIRSRISLWITGAGILVSLIFSVVIFWEMHEQIFRELDSNLKASVRTVFAIVQSGESKGRINLSPEMEYFFGSQHYWIRVQRGDQLLYASRLAQKIDLPIDPQEKKSTVSIILPKSKIYLRQDRHNEVTFRVRVETISTSMAPAGYRIQVAVPMEKLDEEIVEVVTFIIMGLIFSTLLLVFISYFLAGRILQPVSWVTDRAREINDKELDVRIPLGESRDELYELSEALNQMLDRLQYSFKQQKEFLANAAHELKTPVTNARLFVEQGLSNSELPDSFRENLTRQHEIMLRMGRLLHNLMMLSGLELERKIVPVSFDFKALTESVLADFQPLFETQEISLKIDLPEKLPWFGDEDKLRRVLVNIIENAIKYNTAPAAVRVTLQSLETGLLLKVANRSQPIPENELEKVFEQFHRVEKSRSLEFGGCGLGLTIVREIVTLHGGEITLQNQPEGWVQVTVQLPELEK